MGTAADRARHAMPVEENDAAGAVYYRASRGNPGRVGGVRLLPPVPGSGDDFARVARPCDAGAARDRRGHRVEPDRPRAAVQVEGLSLIHISEPTRLLSISYAVFCLKKK